MTKQAPDGGEAMSADLCKHPEALCVDCQKLIPLASETTDAGLVCRLSHKYNCALNRDALAAVAEAARTVAVLSADLDRWDELNGYVVNSERDYLAHNLSTAWDRLRDALAAYDRTVAKPCGGNDG